MFNLFKTIDDYIDIQYEKTDIIQISTKTPVIHDGILTNIRYNNLPLRILEKTKKYITFETIVTSYVVENTDICSECPDHLILDAWLHESNVLKETRTTKITIKVKFGKAYMDISTHSKYDIASTINTMKSNVCKYSNIKECIENGSNFGFIEFMQEYDNYIKSNISFLEWCNNLTKEKLLEYGIDHKNPIATQNSILKLVGTDLNLYYILCKSLENNANNPDEGLVEFLDKYWEYMRNLRIEEGKKGEYK